MNKFERAYNAFLVEEDKHYCGHMQTRCQCSICGGRHCASDAEACPVCTRLNTLREQALTLMTENDDFSRIDFKARPRFREPYTSKLPERR